MKIKDYIIHIFLFLIILLGFILMTVFYYYNIEVKLINQSINEAEEITKADLYDVETVVERYQSRFLNNIEDEKITIVERFVDGYENQFKDNNLVFTMKSNIMRGNDYTYALFFYNSDTKGVGMVECGDVFHAKDKTVITISNTDGSVIYSNSEQKFNQFYDQLRKENNEGLISEIKGDIKEAGAVSVRAKLNGINTIMVGQAYNGFIYFQNISMSANLLSLQAIKNLSFIYFGGILILFVCASVVSSLAIRKALKELLVKNKIYSRKSKNYFLRITKTGKIIKSNRFFKGLVGGAEINNISIFKTEDETPIIYYFEKEQLVKGLYVDDKGKEHIICFSSIPYRGDYFIVGNDITKTYMDEKYLINLSTKNPVTKQNNKLVLATKYDSLVSLSVEKKISFISLSIKEFRKTNKLLGRQTGDLVLIAFVDLLKKIFEDENVYHVEADNFLVVSIEDSHEETVKKCNLLCEQLKKPIVVNNNQIFILTNIGIYNLEPRSGYTFEECLYKTNIAYISAKNSLSRDIVTYDRTLQGNVDRIAQMQRDLANAVKNNEFEMYYQPQYDVNDEKIVGFEALIRWNNPKYIGHSPQEFIELAEESGAIIEIGNFVIKSVFKSAKEFEQYDVHLSMNVSPAQILQVGFVQDLLAAYEEVGLKPGSVALEITETFLMESFDLVIEKLKVLKKHGFSIHLDDFGTGYSSMLYLKDLPIDTIKIDKDFVKHIETDKFSRIIVKKIISLGQELEMNVICEGVETSTQRSIVKKFGCPTIQGYLVGKAMSMDVALDELQNIKESSKEKPSKTKK